MKPLHILVTAGPTREPIDPVRFISNYSTGTMGYAIAESAKFAGHKVTLITGPTRLQPPRNIRVIPVVTAREMFNAVRGSFKASDCIVMAAAVSDFRARQYSRAKIKRAGGRGYLKLSENPDILKWLSRHKGDRLVAGFCMETSNLAKNAKAKMAAKRTDIMLANRIDAGKSAFGSGPASILVIEQGKETVLAGISKRKAAAILLEKIEQLWYKKSFSRK